MKQKMNEEEFDATSKWRHILRWKSGERKRIKKGLRKKIRIKNKKSLRDIILEKWYGENEDE